jgi:hypothetical protein
MQGVTVFPYPSTLETLIAFGVVFVLGLLWSKIHHRLYGQRFVAPVFTGELA